MADQIRVRCVNKLNRMSAHERIHSIGGLNGDGTRWKLSEGDAILGIQQGRWDFHVEVNGRLVGVIIAQHQGRFYLKTVADAYSPDNLLSLPECP